MALVRAQMDAAADLTLSKAAREWGLALLAAGRPGDAVGAFRAAIAEEAAQGERARLMVLQAYAHDVSDDPEQAMRGYLDGVREDGKLIGEVAARLHALLTPLTASVLGPWISGAWADSVRSALADHADGPRFRAQLEVLVAHVHAVRREHALAAEALQAAMIASPVDVAAFADDLPGWVEASLKDPKSGARLYLLLAELALLLGHAEDALTDADAALAAGLTDEDHPYGDAPGHEMRAQALREIGRTAEAVQALLAAAYRHIWAENWTTAEPLLRQIIELDPTCQDAWWLRANERLVRAGRGAAEDPARADPTGLREALDLWHSGYALGPPRGEGTWAYYLAADIHRGLATVSMANAAEHHWRAVLYAERGLVSAANPSHYVYGQLSWSYRTLGSAAAALALIEGHEAQARSAGSWSDADPDADIEASEKAVIHLYLGHYDKALEILRRSEEREHPADMFSPWWMAEVRGIALMMSGEEQEARAVLDGAVKENPRSSELLGHAAACCRRQGDREAEREYRERVLALTAPDEPGTARNDEVRVAALYRQGRYEEARALMEPVAASPWWCAGGRAWVDAWHGLCQLALGLPEAAATLRRGADEATSAWQTDGSAFELKLLEEAGAEAATSSDGEERFSELFARRTRELAERIPDIAVAEGELRAAAVFPGAPAEVRVVVTAAIGRMRLDAGDPSAAAEAYSSLLDEDELFPEAPEPYAKSVAVLLREHLRADRLAEASELAAAAVDTLASVAARRPGSVPQALLGLLASSSCHAWLRLGRHPEALDALGAALEAYAQVEEVQPVRAVGAAWRDCLGSAAAYWDLIDQAERCRADLSAQAAPTDAVRAPAEEPGTPLTGPRVIGSRVTGSRVTGSRADALAQAVDECGRYLDELFGFAGGPLEPEPVPHVRVWLGSALVSPVLQDQDVLIRRMGPIRTRIRERTGVEVPGVNFQDDETLGPDAFAIAVAGVPRVYQSGVPGGNAPVTVEARSDGAPEDGPEVLGPMFVALEDLLERSLPAFLGTQETHDLVRSWAEEDSAQKQVEAALPDPEAWLRLGVLVRRLAARRIPLRWAAVIREAARTGLTPESIDTSVEALRAASHDDPPDDDQSDDEPSDAASRVEPRSASVSTNMREAREASGPQAAAWAPPPRPVSLPMDVRLTVPGAAELSSAATDLVHREVADLLTWVAGKLGLATEPAVVIEDRQGPDAVHGDDLMVRVVVNGRRCRYAWTLPITLLTSMVGFVGAELGQIATAANASDQEGADAAVAFLAYHVAWLTTQAATPHLSELLHDFWEGVTRRDARERLVRGWLDSGLAIAEPSEPSAPQGEGVPDPTEPSVNAPARAQWALLIEPGYLRELSLAVTSADEWDSAIRGALNALATEIGLPLPSFRVAADSALPVGCFSIRSNLTWSAPVRGIPPGQLLVPDVTAIEGIDGTVIMDPVSGRPGMLVAATAADELTRRGLRFLEPVAYLYHGLSWTVRERAGRLAEPARVDAALEALRQQRPVQYELARHHLASATLPDVLRDLVEEGVPVRNLPAIIDLLLEYELCRPPHAPDRLAWTRARMREVIGVAVAEGFRAVEVIPLPSEMEAAVSAWEDSGRHDESARDGLLTMLRNTALIGLNKPLLAPVGLRRATWAALHEDFPSLRVLALPDLPADFTVRRSILPPSDLVSARTQPDDHSTPDVAGQMSVLLSNDTIAQAPDVAVLQGWLSTSTWSESADFLREHADQLLAPAVRALLAGSEEAQARRHREILRLTDLVPVDGVADALASPTAAADRALDAVAAGDVGLLTTLLSVAPSVEATAAMQALIAMVLALAAGDDQPARDLAAYIADTTDTAPESERRRCARLLRSFAANTPDLATAGELAETVDW